MRNVKESFLGLLSYYVTLGCGKWKPPNQWCSYVFIHFPQFGRLMFKSKAWVDTKRSTSTRCPPFTHPKLLINEHPTVVGLFCSFCRLLSWLVLTHQTCSFVSVLFSQIAGGGQPRLRCWVRRRGGKGEGPRIHLMGERWIPP